MRKLDLISGFFLLALATFICVASLQMDVGTPNAPGSGFYPLLTGLVLAVFSLIILYQALRNSLEPVRFWLPGANRKAILTAFAIILLYALLLERLGFLATTILFFALVSRFVSGHRWKTTIIFSLLASAATYSVFKYLLQAPLPQGIFEGLF